MIRRSGKIRMTGWIGRLLPVLAGLLILSGCGEQEAGVSPVQAPTQATVEQSGSGQDQPDPLDQEQDPTEPEDPTDADIPSEEQGAEMPASKEDLLQEELERMLQNISLEEYRGESILTLSSLEWKETMLPNAYDRAREFCLTTDLGKELYVCVKCTEEGGYYTSVRYTDKEGERILEEYQLEELPQDLAAQDFSLGKMTLIMTSVSNNQYEGEFTRWTINAATGDIVRQQGKFAAGKEAKGTKSITHKGTESSQLYSLWCNRESFSYVDEKGKKVEDPFGNSEDNPAPSTQEPTPATPSTQKPSTQKPTTPKPTPAPTPAPAPEPTPAPTPAPAPEPTPAPAPEPQPEPTPAPAPQPEPAPAPAPEPEPEPTPAPEPQPEPAPEPAPEPTPTPAPAPENPGGGSDVDIEWTPDIM